MVTNKCVMCGILAATAFGAFARETVVLVEAHPDDLAGHGGTAILLSEKFDVRVIDFTRGEFGLGEAPYRDGTCAEKRVEEEKKACAFLGTEPIFMDQVDYRGAKAFAGEKVTLRMAELFRKWKPRAFILHWPVDIHPDHVQSAAAALHAIYLAGLSPEIYFQEQTTQSRGFRPAYHVDISRVKERKDGLIRCYACQNGEAIRGRKEEDAVFRARRVGIWSPQTSLIECFAVFEGSVTKGKSIFFELDAKAW